MFSVFLIAVFLSRNASIGINLYIETNIPNTSISIRIGLYRLVEFKVTTFLHRFLMTNNLEIEFTTLIQQSNILQTLLDYVRKLSIVPEVTAKEHGWHFVTTKHKVAIDVFQNTQTSVMQNFYINIVLLS